MILTLTFTLILTFTLTIINHPTLTIPNEYCYALETQSYTQSNLNAEWREANDALSKSEGRRRKLLLVLLSAELFLAHAVTHSPDMFMGV